MAAVAPRKGLGDAENAAPPGSCLYKKKIRLHLFCCFKQQILYRQFTNRFTGMRGALFKRFTLLHTQPAPDMPQAPAVHQKFL